MTKPGVIDLNKWTEKTAQMVRETCSRKQAPCIAVALLFYNPMVPEEKRWNFTIQLAMDPHAPLTEADRQAIEQAMEFIMAGVQKIMSGELEEGENIADYMVIGKVH